MLVPQDPGLLRPSVLSLDLVKGAGFPPFSQQCCQLFEENVLYQSLLFVCKCVFGWNVINLFVANAAKSLVININIVPGNVLITNNMLFLAPRGTQKKERMKVFGLF